MDKGCSGKDSFDAILATARGIGFQVPEPTNTGDRVLQRVPWNSPRFYHLPLLGILPRRWIERALVQLPKNLKSVAFNFKAPEGEEELTETEYIIILQTLFQKRNPVPQNANQGSRREPLLSSTFAMTTHVAIPCTLDPMTPLENRTNSVLPVESFELHGANVTHAVLKELCYCTTHASHQFRLQSLVISGADLDCEGTGKSHLNLNNCSVIDPLLWLSMSGPLMRSLRKLTIKNCKGLKVVDPCTWALFLGTVPLESISILNSGNHSVSHDWFADTIMGVLGYDCNDVSFVCQVLCANEIPSFNLKKLDLRVGKHKLSIERNRMQYSEPNFVHISRCVARLTELEHLKLDCLNTDQKLQLYEDWKSTKGSNQCFIQSDELSTFLHLAIGLHNEEEEGIRGVVGFEQSSVITQNDSSIDKISSQKAHAPVNFSNICDHQEIQFRNQNSSQRKPILTSSKATLNPSEPASVKKQSHQSVLDKLWSRYKPPRLKPMRASNPPRRSSKQQGQIQAPTRQAKAQKVSMNNAKDLHKTKGKRQRSRSQKHKGPPPKSMSSLVMVQSESVSDEQTSASSEEYDSDEERRFGPPLGGRTVIVESTEGTSDLMGYTHDGFIRPDDEMVYTTSASEGEIERDLDALQKHCEIVMSTSESSLEEVSDQESLGTPSPTFLANHSTQLPVAPLPDQISRDHNLRDPIDELQKELMELQPFYYDKQREKHKPRKIFSDLPPAGDESSGLTLRSGKRLGIESPSRVVIPPEDTTLISDKFEMASGSNLVSCSRQGIDKSILADTIIRDVSGIDDKASTIDVNLNQSCPSKSKGRLYPCREALKLQPWSWDPKYEKRPPNYQMYMTSKKKRTERKTSIEEKQDKQRRTH